MVWKKAIEDAVAKTLNNIDRFGDRFPHVSQNGVYRQIENNDWTNGFWSGNVPGKAGADKVYARYVKVEFPVNVWVFLDEIEILGIDGKANGAVVLPPRR
ncbi:Unsaturated glucuronyl hydrolase [Chlamydia abortus]|uniref:Uncharacterized protein n=1 Tax=Paenibacillus residui TaxID=629724 RepID=A0ABW3DI44_9BACL|nr:hypothetical protein [Paenibacillus sp. 32O-W]SHE11745.1 Unsaturated glucuronyl hydrolase [Chlamydia abortus]